METCAICGKELVNIKYAIPNGQNKFICQECNDRIALCMTDREDEKAQEAWQTLREQQEMLEDSDVTSYLSLLLSSRNRLKSTESSEAKNISEDREGGMFGDIGKKIKGVTKLNFWIEVIACIVGGCILISQDSYYNPTATLGFVIMLAGPVVAWLGSLFSYGLGELIDQTKIHNQLLSETLNKGRRQEK